MTEFLFLISASRRLLIVMATGLLIATIDDARAENDFPVHTLQPKSETGLDRFLEAHPEYDGRGTVVAIFDTGVDPGAPGLQVTSDGKPKIIDLIDGSGSGDVPTDTVQTSEEGTLQGLSGRTLTLGRHQSVDGQYHLGIKSAWDIYPGGLVRRVRAERRLLWDEGQRALEARVRAELEEWEQENPDPDDSAELMHKEMKLRVKLLAELQENYDDPGPAFDCVVFYDGSHWRALIDTNEDGDLGDEEAMANYRVERQWSTFDDTSLLNFAVNIYEDGNLLSIVADCGAHGTHVAGTVAAFDPDHPELNGMAPGAQIVGVKIGDTRLGASSVGTGPSRGIVAVLENHCDLVNMSYGGSSALSNKGHVVDLYDELVYDHGVIFVSSAGNDGPGLSSAGSPGATTGSLIGVGAYVSGEMMTGQDSMREPLADTHYTWSSRGPTLDGALGTDFSAPGGAVSPVPNWSLQPNTLMHGTSMASPNACGGIACLISGLKAEGLPYTQQQVRRALQNTAVDVPGTDKFALGAGLVQFDAAWESLVAYAPYSPTGVRFDVRVPARVNARGIYLREPWEVERATELNVSIDPEFRQEVDNREKVDFQLQVALESNATWVQVPDHLLLQAGGRSFRVLVDPRALPTGVHYAEITGVDLDAPEQGPIFRVPVTIVKPQRLDPATFRHRETLTFEAGEIHRCFFVVPDGATWADLIIRAGDRESDRSLVVHTIQLEPGQAFSSNRHRSYGRMSANEERIRSFEVLPGRTLELVLAHGRSNLEPTESSYDLVFHGLVPSEQELMMDGAYPTRLLTVTASLGPETIQPKAKLTRRRIMLRPTGSELRAMPGTRDLLPREKRVHSLVLTYKLELDADAKVTLVPGLYGDGRYWDRWQSGLYMIFDEGKKRITTGIGSTVELEEGTYTIRFQVRHTRPELLESVDDYSLGVDIELDSPISLSMYADPFGSADGGRSFGSRELQRGEMATAWIGSPVAGELPDGLEAGDMLRGRIQYGEERSEQIGSGRKPGGYEIAVRVPKEVESGEEDSSGPGAASDSSDTEDDRDRLTEELRDLQVRHLRSLRGENRDEDFRHLLDRLLKQYPDHLELLVERVRFLSGKLESDSKSEEVSARDVTKACDAVIERVDAEKIAARLGLQVDEEDDDAREAQKEAEETRAFLIEVHRLKCQALLTDGTESLFVEAFRELDRWVDSADKDSAVLRARRESQRGRIATGLEILDTHIEDERFVPKNYELRAELFDKLNWISWAELEREWMLQRTPASFAPF